ncbi:MAG: PorP/SprF family type IX secretion system membrane protein [Bacteroidota bacterium]
MKYIVVFILLSVFTSHLSSAQDARFSQFYANPIYLNPSLAGITGDNRMVLVHRQQGNSLNGFTTSAFSMDGRLGESSGYGFQLVKDAQLNNVVNTIEFAGVAAHRIAISEDAQLGLGLRVGYFQRILDFGKLTFEDQLDQRYGITGTTDEQFERTTVSAADISLGMIYTAKHFYAGASLNHINQPQQNFDEEESSFLPIRYTIHAGGFIRNNNFRKSDFVLSPNLIYQRQGEFSYLHVGAYFGSELWTLGAWYRVNNNVVAMLGFNLNKFRFGYSYDLPVGNDNTGLQNAHEITAAYSFRFSKKNKVKNRYNGKCPMFQRRLF